MNPVRVLGGGPAGSSAAIAAASEGAAVQLFEKASVPRHKVCGEFLSPEIEPILEEIGVWADFQDERPARMLRAVMHIGGAEKRWKLAETAFGLSRYAFDSLLLNRARALGASLIPSAGVPGDGPVIESGGRRIRPGAAAGSRLFGFKAHFQGPVDDAVELYFFDRCYVGVSPVENGVTNVCGLAPEGVLRSLSFQLDAVAGLSRPLSCRLAPLSRISRWLMVGPLLFRNRLEETPAPHTYPAGDNLSFVDPFAGTGILAALFTGRLAGVSAARRLESGAYLAACRKALRTQFRIASILRRLVWAGLAGRLSAFTPGPWLFQLTRPRLQMKSR